MTSVLPETLPLFPLPGVALFPDLPLPLHIKQSMLEINESGVRLQVLQRFLARQGLI